MKQLELIEHESFKIHCLNGHIQTTYLVEYSDKLLLLDGGCKCDSKEIRHFIVHQLKRPLRDLQLCVVTHMHPDHAGGAGSLRSHTGTKIAAMEMIDQWYKGFGGFLQHKVDTYLAWWVARKQNRQKRRILYPRRVNPDFLLKDGDPLPGFPDWVMIHTPGHTSHDGCLFHAETGIFYAGDLLVKIKTKFLPPFPVTLTKAMCSSLKKVNELPIHTVLLAHGGPIVLKDEPIDFQQLCNYIGKQNGLTFRIVKLGSQFNAEMRRAKKQKWDYH